MCEFKVIDKKTGEQLGEDIVILSYSEDNALLLKDILGLANEVKSSLIYEVNTLDQTCTVIQHPLVNSFVTLLEKISTNHIQVEDIEQVQSKLEEIKKEL
jgi:predicted RNA-binding protein